MRLVPAPSGGLRSPLWIPAFAGMTAEIRQRKPELLDEPKIDNELDT